MALKLEEFATQRADCLAAGRRIRKYKLRIIGGKSCYHYEMQHDFVAIGDNATDEFIRLKDAEVHCDINSEHCTICMRWGDKIPFESSVLIPGVGNAANAAVAAARLGLSTAFISNIGDDRVRREERRSLLLKEKTWTLSSCTSIPAW